jgi:hypothetical protein
MNVGDTFVIDALPEGMTARSIKTYYNQAARVPAVHLRWRRGDNPIAAQVVAEPTSDELRAESRRLATRRRPRLQSMSRDPRSAGDGLGAQ